MWDETNYPQPDFVNIPYILYWTWLLIYILFSPSDLFAKQIACVFGSLLSLTFGREARARAHFKRRGFPEPGDLPRGFGVLGRRGQLDLSVTPRSRSLTRKNTLHTISFRCYLSWVFTHDWSAALWLSRISARQIIPINILTHFPVRKKLYQTRTHKVRLGTKI